MSESNVDATAEMDVDAIPDQKAARIEKEKQGLLDSLASGDFSTMKAKVAGVLNLYPSTRNSDVALAIKYWELFQPDIFNATAIHPRDLFKLERFHLIVRARAKIQNQYQLFLADEGVRHHRKHREEDMREAVMEDSHPRPLIRVFSDETGKNDSYVIVAAVWALTGRAEFSVSQAIDSWQQKSIWNKREVHFARFGKGDLDTLSEYIDVISANREFLSIKLAAVERARTRRPIEEVVRKLHEFMLIRGLEHELRTNRISLPREVEMTVDHEQSLDAFVLSEMHRNILGITAPVYGDAITLRPIAVASSRKSKMIQLADVLAGAVNRKLNHVGERNHKDEMADLIIDKLGIGLEREDIPDLDSTALFVV